MSRAALIALAALLPAVPAVAQEMDHSMPGMVMPAQPAKPAAAPPADPHAGHDMSTMPGMVMSEPPADEHLGGDIPQAPPPPPPTDFAADRSFDPEAMAAARRGLRKEHGDIRYGNVMANLAEYQGGAGGDGYRWEGQASYGGDINRFLVRSEGEGAGGEGVAAAEAQALYSRAVTRYFNLEAGLRQDFQPHNRTYLAVGTEGLFPYWFDVRGAAFLSDKGEVLARAEGTYDLRLTQRLILQPRGELNFAAQDTPDTQTGPGLSNAELGLRLRYEIRREFAPYVGVSYDCRFGKTADYARAAGDDPEATRFVIGLRAWF